MEILTTRPKKPLKDWKIVGKVAKVFNKEAKGYVIYLHEGASIILPTNERYGLALVQSNIVFQMFLHPGKKHSIEIAVTDLEGVKRRLKFCPCKEIVKNPLHARIPNQSFKTGVWTNLSICSNSFFLECFPGRTFRSIDLIYISGE